MTEYSTLTVALSGGGVAGLGHIPVLGALDELNIKPAAISGSSMGALIAASYAAGMSAAEIEQHVLEIARSPMAYTRRYIASGWHGLLTGAIHPEHVLDAIAPDILPETIADLNIPTTIVATDFHRREPVLFRNENLRKSLAASIAIPGVFKPVSWDGRILVDGGVCNNLPIDVLPASDYTLAVDVASEPATDERSMPGTVAAVTSSVRIMLQTLAQLLIQQRDNVIFIQPDSRAVSPLDLGKLEEAIELARPQKALVKRRLEEAFNRR